MSSTQDHALPSPSTRFRTKPSSSAPSALSSSAGRKRASRACLVCRLRKVRCDIVKQVPCGNCLWHGEKCVVPTRKRRPRLVGDKDSVAIGGHKGAAPIRDNPCENENIHDEGLQDISPAASPGGHWAAKAPTIYAEETIDASRLQKVGSVAPTESLKTRLGSPTKDSALSSFSNLDEDTHQFLRAKGVFELPPLNFRNTCLRAYDIHIRPSLPFVDIEPLIVSNTSFPEASPTPNPNILLSQAILAVGVLYINSDLLHEAGYDTPQQASASFSKKARLLYDFNCETDPFVLAQACLLLAMASDLAQQIRDQRYWIDTAISHAVSGHVTLASPSPDTTCVIISKQLRRRIWWSCYVADRICSLRTGLPTRIRDDEMEIPTLTENDFEPEHTVYSEHENSSHFTSASERSGLKQSVEIAQIFIAQVELCRSLQGIIQLRTISDGVRVGTLPKFSNNIDDQFNEDLKFATCSRSISQWKDSLPESLRQRPMNEVVADASAFPRAADLARDVMHCLYYEASVALYRSKTSLLRMRLAPATMEQDMCTQLISAGLANIMGLSMKIHPNQLFHLDPVGWEEISTLHTSSPSAPEDGIASGYLKVFSSKGMNYGSIRSYTSEEEESSIVSTPELVHGVEDSAQDMSTPTDTMEESLLKQLANYEPLIYDPGHADKDTFSGSCWPMETELTPEGFLITI